MAIKTNMKRRSKATSQKRKKHEAGPQKLLKASSHDYQEASSRRHPEANQSHRLKCEINLSTSSFPKKSKQPREAKQQIGRPREPKKAL
jgi:hypothetical protein